MPRAGARGRGAQLPQDDAHDDGGGEQNEEEDGLVAGNHGWRASVVEALVRHSRMAAARAWATRVW